MNQTIPNPVPCPLSQSFFYHLHMPSTIGYLVSLTSLRQTRVHLTNSKSSMPSQFQSQKWETKFSSSVWHEYQPIRTKARQEFLLWHGRLDPWPGNFHKPWVGVAEGGKKKKKEQRQAKNNCPLTIPQCVLFGMILFSQQHLTHVIPPTFLKYPFHLVSSIPHSFDYISISFICLFRPLFCSSFFLRLLG